ncbi:MAG: patatin family protein [Clostridia bacterium]|nr:patatin family protein [Clostridia bacterium]
MKIGLVLEGGAMRGVFTAGILDVFLENGLEFDSCHAVSAGSCLACSFLSRQIGRGYAVMTDYLDNKEYCSVSSLLRTGDLFGADFLYHKIPEQLYPIDNATFLQGKTTFYSVATNCESGRAEYLKVEDLIRDVDAVRASASLPLVSRIVDWKGKPYLDGGIADPIPVEQAFRDGCDRVVVILTRHRAFRKSKEKTALLMGLKYRKYPHLVSTLKERHRIYNDTLARLSVYESDGRALVLAPTEPLEIRRTEKDRVLLRDGYEQGRALALSHIGELRDFISGERGVN